jgi:enediyne biosynthesis protein E4
LRDGRFEEIGLRAGLALRQRRVSRGLAVADFINDGAVGALLTNLDGTPTLLRNASNPRGHWVRLKLIGVRSNRDAFGARVEIVAAGLKQVDEIRANRSFLSASDSRLHFGLGSATRVDQVVIHWPSGLVERFASVPADGETVIREGAGNAIPIQPKR